jgi:pimeloyl-ACP methyl ester carboxylesterase
MAPAWHSVDSLQSRAGVAGERVAEAFRLPHQFVRCDPAVRREPVDPHAADGLPLGGVLYLPPRRDPDVALLAMHPRVDFSRHYLAPGLAAAGYAFLGATTRYLGNDADALHERLLLDVAGAVAWLRARGFRRVVLLGNSGGGSLSAFYLEQAGRPADERLAAAPSGDPVPLGAVDLPPADGLVLLAAHLGEGVFMLDRLDASVVDEGDPVTADPRVDMYDPRNGYRPMAEGPSRYAPAFVAELRAAQRARCERLDRMALAACEEAAFFRRALRGAPPDVGAADRMALVRRALQRRYFVIYRTLADPRYLDPTLEPSGRPLGSIFSFGRDPVVGNYGEGIGRVMSARGWLSTWSGLSSRAALERTLPSVAVPTLVVAPTADTDVHPGECRRAFAACAAPDKAWVPLPGVDHYLRRAGGDGDDPRDRLLHEHLLPWLRARWPV